MLEVVWRRLGGRTRCLVSLFAFPVSLSLSFHFVPFPSFSLYLSPCSVHSSPHPSSVPPNSPLFFFLSLTHFICYPPWLLLYLPLSLALSLALLLFLSFFLSSKLPLGPSYSSRGEPSSVPVAVALKSQALVSPSLSSSLQPFLVRFSRNDTIVFLILKIKFFPP